MLSKSRRLLTWHSRLKETTTRPFKRMKTLRRKCRETKAFVPKSSPWTSRGSPRSIRPPILSGSRPRLRVLFTSNFVKVVMSTWLR